MERNGDTDCNDRCAYDNRLKEIQNTPAMRNLGFLLQKEFRQIFRDKTILAMMLALPVIQLLVLPWAMNLDIKNINLSIVDHDHSTFSQQLTTKIGSSGYFRIVSADRSYKDALNNIENGSADLIMELPVGFERNLVREGSQTIGISVDAINGTKASIGGAYLGAVINDFNANLQINQVGIPDSVRQPGGFIDIASGNWYNPLEEYKYFFVPGVLVLLLTMIGGFMTALNIVREKEVGTIEQINVTPIKKWEFILGKLIPFWIIGMIVFSIGLTVIRIVYGISSAGSIPLLYAVAGIYLTALLGFGLLISTFCDNQVQAMFVAFFFILIFILMSGLFTAVQSMPYWARIISAFTPVSHFIKIVRMIMLKGSGLSDILKELGYILTFGLVLNVWAIWNYRKTS
jgi:ABC-2 type transport system permease protein